MKTLACILAACLLTAGCQKDPTSPNTTNPTEFGYTKSVGERAYTLTGEAGNRSCPRPADNCTKHQKLTVEDDHGVTAVFEAVATNDPQQVIAIFTAKKSVLVDVMAAEDIDAVIAGDLTASDDWDATSKTHYLVLSSSTRVEVAYPFEFE